MVTAFGGGSTGGIDEPNDGTDRPQFESTDTLKAARFLKFVTILKLLRNIFKDFQTFLRQNSFFQLFLLKTRTRVTRLAKALRNWEEVSSTCYYM